MGEFIGSTPFFVIMGLLLVGLIGLLIYMRTRPKDE
jgi:LPXTG-motif cell wall-anchored protein